MELCEHLQPVLRDLLAQGNAVRQSVTGWSEVDLAVDLRDWVNLAGLRERVPLAPCVEAWQNTDGHYELQEGLVCRVHRHSLAWPLHRPRNGR